jgi:hypothetical protein
LYLVATETIIPAPARAAIADVRATKEWWVIKEIRMKTTPNRDLLVLFRNEFMSPKAMEKEVDCLNDILRMVELPDEFCKAHELLQRNRITQKTHKLLNAFRQTELNPFWFLISKN